MRRVHVWIEGRVQGVFFRATCVERARALSVSGWVRNMPDGRVEAELEGEPHAVEEMVAWCREGPALARVETFDMRELEPIGETGFRAIHSY